MNSEEELYSYILNIIEVEYIHYSYYLQFDKFPSTIEYKKYRENIEVDIGEVLKDYQDLFLYYVSAFVDDFNLFRKIGRLLASIKPFDSPYIPVSHREKISWMDKLYKLYLST